MKANIDFRDYLDDCSEVESAINRMCNEVVCQIFDKKNYSIVFFPIKDVLDFSLVFSNQDIVLYFNLEKELLEASEIEVFPKKDVIKRLEEVIEKLKRREK